MTAWCAAAAVCLAALGAGADEAAGRPFAVEVLDDRTGRGVPLVELRTVHGLRYVTDSAGVAAIDAVELEGRRVYFHLSSHGYEFPADGFGFRGKALDVARGRSAVLRIARRNLAERLYRVTGAGIYADSVAVGRPAPRGEPLLAGRVAGSDSVVQALFRGRIHWFWGDTNRLEYPLGNFHVPGAVSKPPQAGGAPPDQGVELDYFVGPDGFAKETARMAGDGPTWISGLAVVRDQDGRERMFAGYMKVRKLLEVYRRGIAEFDPERSEFVHRVDVPVDAPLLPDGHPLVAADQGVDYVYFARPYPWTRTPARPEKLLDVASYEGFTCLKPGDRRGDGEVERDAEGRAVWGWKRDAAPWDEKLERRLIADGRLRESERRIGLRDRDSGRPVSAHGGSVAWNAYRERWIMIFVEQGGSSPLGEVWYAESKTLEGPWSSARKIATHVRYSFYNPKHHPLFDEDGGRRIYFEGTYTHTFSGNPDPTPRYDYNQLMYRLDLTDPRLHAAGVETSDSTSDASSDGHREATSRAAAPAGR